MLNKVLAVGLAVAILAGAGVAWAWSRSLNDLRDERIDHANALADADTSRIEIRQEADSQVAVAERLAFQTQVTLREAFRNDSVELEAHMSARLSILEDSLKASNEGTVAETDSSGVVTVSGHLDAMDSLGVDVRADVTIPPAAPSIWNWALKRAAMSLELALSCSGDLAVAQLAGPAWASLAIDSVAQDPEICIPPVRPAWNPFSFKPPTLPWLIGLFVAGMAVGAR